MNETLNRAAAAEEVGLTPRILADFASKGKGPPFYKLSRNTILYPRVELMQWRDDQLRVARVTPAK